MPKPLPWGARLQHILTTLKVTQLQRLCRLTGQPISGANRPELIGRLERDLMIPKLPVGSPDATDKERRAPQTHRILSIDMGIRNMAYCRLLVNNEAPKDVSSNQDGQIAVTRPGDGTDLDVLPSAPEILGPIIVEDWHHWHDHRFSLDPGPKPASANAATAAKLAAAAKADSTAEAFTPSVMSGWALNILESLVLNAAQGPPDTILIEKQRWRSNGMAAVQEWTIRVNCLEAMLWMGLRMLQDKGLWRGRVHAVDPGAVTRFFVGDYNGHGDKVRAGAVAEGKSQRVTKADATKAAKVGVAKAWVQGGVTVAEDGRETDIDLLLGHGERSRQLRFEGSTQDVSYAFLWRDFVRGRGNKAEKAERAGVDLVRLDKVKIGKQNDLADCLLQGVAWVKWEQNRRAINAGQAVLAPKKIAEQVDDENEAKIGETPKDRRARKAIKAKKTAVVQMGE